MKKYLYNKYFIPVEAIKYTGDNLDHIAKRLCETYDITEEDLDIDVDCVDGDGGALFTLFDDDQYLPKGSYIVFNPYAFIGVFTEEQFEKMREL